MECSHVQISRCEIRHKMKETRKGRIKGRKGGGKNKYEIKADVFK
jgi:hypothetical protein